MLWTDEVKEELIKFVQNRDSSLTMSDAFKAFAEMKGPQYNHRTASTVYYTETRKNSGFRRRSRNNASGARGGHSYSPEEERIIFLTTVFGRREGLRKRDIARYFVAVTNRPLRGVEQKMDGLEANPPMDVPDEVPEEIKSILVQIKSGRDQSRAISPSEEFDDNKVYSTVEISELDTLESLSVLSRATRKIRGVDVDSLIRQLAMIANLAVDNAESANVRNEMILLTRDKIRLTNEVQDLTRRNEELEEKIETFERRLVEYDEWVDEVKRQQDVVNFVVEELTKLRTIEQIGGLKDYLGKIQLEMDKFGSLVRSVDMWREKLEEQFLASKDELNERFHAWQADVASAREVS